MSQLQIWRRNEATESSVNKVPLKLHLQKSLMKGLFLEERYFRNSYLLSAPQGVVSVYWTLKTYGEDQQHSWYLDVGRHKTVYSNFSSDKNGFQLR
jgi:hypothetical protein